MENTLRSRQQDSQSIDPWTVRELTEIGCLAIDNALDTAADGLAMQTFEDELSFQLAAPEHHGRPALTEKEIALVRAVWDLEMPPPALPPDPSNPQPAEVTPNKRNTTALTELYHAAKNATVGYSPVTMTRLLAAVRAIDPAALPDILSQPSAVSRPNTEDSYPIYLERLRMRTANLEREKNDLTNEMRRQNETLKEYDARINELEWGRFVQLHEDLAFILPAKSEDSGSAAR